jgi:hypothetical protein
MPIAYSHCNDGRISISRRLMAVIGRRMPVMAVVFSSSAMGSGAGAAATALPVDPMPKQAPCHVRQARRKGQRAIMAAAG